MSAISRKSGTGAIYLDWRLGIALVYRNGQRDRPAFKGRLEFTIKLIPRACVARRRAKA
ncbi:MAG: hypothetical protein HY527_04195 [Betaproteobacteria bacterium]|nr:hypothetical protein [Betaproteobacteria bacterium]